jgi:hypothetical protein
MRFTTSHSRTLDQSSISSSRQGAQTGSVEELHARILVPAGRGAAIGTIIGAVIRADLGMIR